MPKTKTPTDDPILGLPYLEIGEVATRPKLREWWTRGGKESYYIPFKELKIRPGFNLRGELTGIVDLAMDISANGLIIPLTVDVLKDGTVYIEMGHRRHAALQYLHDQGLLKGLKIRGLDNGKIECYVNTSEVDELTRIKRQYSSNNHVAYTALEIANLCLRLETFFNMGSTEIGKSLGISRQQVTNMLILAKESDDVKQAVTNGNLTATAAVDLTRKVKDSSKRNAIVQDAVSKKSKIGVKDVQELQDDMTQDEDRSSAGGDLDETKNEVTMCGVVIGAFDKIVTCVSNLPTEFDQVKMDVEHHADLAQKYMQEIQQYVKNCTK